MRSIAEALSTAETTRSRIAKVAALGAALADVFARAPAQLPFATRFVTGSLLPTDDERSLGTGERIVFDAAVSVTGITVDELGSRARKNGDLGSAVGEAVEIAVVAGRLVPAGLPLADAEALALSLAGTASRTAKLEAIEAALRVCTPLEARYVARAMLGEMRVGAKEGIVEDALAKGFGRPLDDVRRAAGLVADMGVLATLAAEDRLAEARVMVGRPIGFMLATPIESARGADLGVPHLVEDKIDGIRAQAHVSADGVRLFARGKGAVTAAFPDVTGPLLASAQAGALPRAVLDGEIVVFGDDGRPRPFSAIQPRLKKTEPDEALLRDHPVKYVVYDLLFEGDEPTLDLPFAERRARLAQWVAKAPAPVLLNTGRALASPEAVDAEFEAARQRGHEGLVLKRLDAPYAAGVRGFAWLKVKKALATLDVVVVAAERGSGRRAGTLSDLTFAVRNGDELLTVGKAYSGLTDEEIRIMTMRLEALADGEETHGRLKVRPEIVIEVAFDGLQRSQRHSSGFALRFPRIAHIRDDKKPKDADTLDAVEALWEAQLASGHREERAAKEKRQPLPKKKAGKKSGYRPDIRATSKQLKLFED